ncbi:ThuA domain-containing protein [Fimbriiglobus ruber]|uniref:Putative glycosyl hydrolase (Putative secreted protein) n=1 Tax=Fimbriiglobus ruber TaxID=1908690 RepID=A0A225DY78_9BACT|nr:ThuA domain-containing protein [Fimbriiglobus ruber]OWK46490.1 putative glycosyl hydrolase (putative secreted protein) [Fimbriiglobus ruber]
MTLLRRAFLCLPLILAAAAPLSAADKPKRVLLVTHSGGFVHDALGFAEDTLKDIGPKNGLEVTCYRFTEDPTKTVKIKPKDKPEVEKTALEAYSERFRGPTGKTVAIENCGRINKDTLKNFDCVLFFTTGNPVNKEELKDLMEWVNAGGAFAGTHCATDTLYDTAYGDLIGGYFDGHPWHQKIKIKVDDPKHPAAKGFVEGDEITDEIYQFKNFNREKLHGIYSVDNSSIDVKKGKRADNDYAVSWVKEYGKGRVFYTSLGHRKDVWKDPRFQTHLLAGLNWAMHGATSAGQ